VTTYFIVAAILVRDKLDVALSEAEKIRLESFQVGEMKSSGTGDNVR
jgi:hypothetical protein